MAITFQPLPLADWQETRDTVAEYARLVRTIRRENTPAQKHWWHVSLRPTTTGFTTTPIRAKDGVIYELEFNFPHHQLQIKTSTGDHREIGLRGQPIIEFREQVFAAFADLGIKAHCDKELYNSELPGVYDKSAVETYWQNLIEIDTVLKEFRYGFLEETSPVQFWSHHFDLAVVWFSGRKVPGQDPKNPEHANEQMNFGFSPGDTGTPEPYFYATAYPLPEGWTDTELLDGAYWNNEGWTGAVLPFQRVVEAGHDGREMLSNFLHVTQSAGARLMQDPTPATAAV